MLAKILSLGLTSLLGVGLAAALPSQPPEDGPPILVVGAGIIGLAAVSALHVLTPNSEITVVTRHVHQAKTALALGAHHTVTDSREAIEALATISGGRLTGRGRGSMISNGFPVSVEAAGSPSAFDLACKATAQRGVVHFMGSIGRVSIDLTPAWFKELDLIGTFAHAVDADPTGERLHSFDRALAILASGGYAAKHIITHRFPLTALREAIDTAHEWWPNAALGGDLGQELPLPRHFRQATETLTREQVAEAVVCGPDPDRHREAIQEFEDAGFDHVYVHQVGPNQDGFIRFFEREILGAVARR